MSQKIATAILVLQALGPLISHAQRPAKAVFDTTVCRIAAHPERFSGKQVRVRASVLSDGLERTVLVDPGCRFGIVPQISTEIRGRPDIQAFEDAIFGQNPGTSKKRIAGVFTGVVSWRSKVASLQIQEITDLEVSPLKKP
jgi:hypothetical protein